MLNIPQRLEAEFEERLRETAIPNSARWLYKKWLRYYLDFCHKYRFQSAQRENLYKPGRCQKVVSPRRFDQSTIHVIKPKNLTAFPVLPPYPR